MHHLWTHLWQLWLARNDDLHGREKDEKERKRLKKLQPLALYSRVDLLLACDKPTIFELPIQERLKLYSRELEAWVRLVTPTVKRALTDAAQYLRDANHTITAFLTPARPNPLTTNELVNELRPVSRLRPWIRLDSYHIFSFLSSRSAFLAHANCAHAAHIIICPFRVKPLRVYLRCLLVGPPRLLHGV